MSTPGVVLPARPGPGEEQWPGRVAAAAVSAWRVAALMSPRARSGVVRVLAVLVLVPMGTPSGTDPYTLHASVSDLAGAPVRDLIVFAVPFLRALVSTLLAVSGVCLLGAGTWAGRVRLVQFARVAHRAAGRRFPCHVPRADRTRARTGRGGMKR